MKRSWHRGASALVLGCALVDCAGDITDPTQADEPETAAQAAAGSGGRASSSGSVASSSFDAASGGNGGAGEGSSATSGGSGGSDAAWQPVASDWCGDEWLGLDDHICFVEPEIPREPPAILFFAHGMMPSDASPKTMQAIVKDFALQNGIVGVFPRGRQGLCQWDPSVETYFCWPTSRATIDEVGPAIVDEWVDAEQRIAAITGQRFEQRYVVGFSNGGYFAATIGIEGLLQTRGIGVVGAGRASVQEQLLPMEPVPYYIAVGELEDAATRSSAENLAFVLQQHDWPVDFVVHPNRGHEIRADDLVGCLTAWAQ